MKVVFAAYMKEKNYDKAVALYMKLTDKVIPALASQALESEGGDTTPDWQKKIDKAKKTMEKNTK